MLWEGPLEDIQTVREREGIYLVVAGHKLPDGAWDEHKWTLLDLGQLPDTDGDLASSERRASWERLLPAEGTLLFKFAEMSPRNFDEIDRLIVETCLRHHHKPLPGAPGGCNGYERDDIIVIANTGYYAPLVRQYTCWDRV